MQPADLQPGDTVLARHSKPRLNARPLITESHAVVEKVYAKDNLVVGRVTRRFAYVEGSPTLGQAVPLVQLEEAFDFSDLVTVLAVAGAKPQVEAAVGGELSMELKVTVKYHLGTSDAHHARVAMEAVARHAQESLQATPFIGDGRCEDCTYEINDLSAQRRPERQRG